MDRKVGLRSRFKLTPLFCLLSFLLSISCLGGQSGTEFCEAVQCNYQIHELDFGEVSSLGYSGAEVASILEKPITKKVLFNNAVVRDPVGESSITISLSIPNGPVSYYQTDGGSCQNKLVIPTSVTLVTEGGELHDTLVGSLEVFGQSIINIYASSGNVNYKGAVLWSERQGTLEVNENIFRLFTKPELVANIWFSTDGSDSSGNLSIGGETVDLGPNRDINSPAIGSW